MRVGVIRGGASVPNARHPAVDRTRRAMEWRVHKLDRRRGHLFGLFKCADGWTRAEKRSFRRERQYAERAAA